MEPSDAISAGTSSNHTEVSVEDAESTVGTVEGGVADFPSGLPTTAAVISDTRAGSQRRKRRRGSPHGAE